MFEKKDRVLAFQWTSSRKPKGNVAFYANNFSVCWSQRVKKYRAVPSNFL